MMDPFHPPDAGKPAPDVVVEIDLENRYDLDLIPTRVNGQPGEFNRDHQDNDKEPLLISPGLVRFVFMNTGTISHNLRIQGTDPQGQEIDVIAPAPPDHLMEGQMGEMEISLWEGEYELSCAVTNHDRRGMWRPLIVTSDVSLPPPPMESG
jgi:hypothetical protein